MANYPSGLTDFCLFYVACFLSMIQNCKTGTNMWDFCVLSKIISHLNNLLRGHLAYLQTCCYGQIPTFSWAHKKVPSFPKRLLSYRVLFYIIRDNWKLDLAWEDQMSVVLAQKATFIYQTFIRKIFRPRSHVFCLVFAHFSRINCATVLIFISLESELNSSLTKSKFSDFSGNGIHGKWIHWKFDSKWLFSGIFLESFEPYKSFLYH